MQNDLFHSVILLYSLHIFYSIIISDALKEQFAIFGNTLCAFLLNVGLQDLRHSHVCTVNIMLQLSTETGSS